MPGNPAPGYARKPDHVVAVAPFEGRVRAVLNGVAIAESTRAFAVEESNYPVCYYIPREDVRMDLAARTEHSTHCPFKGDAAYYTFAVDGDARANAAWSYEAPFDEALALKDCISFYGSRIDAIEVE